MVNRWHLTADSAFAAWLRSRDLTPRTFLEEHPGVPWSELVDVVDESMAPIQLIICLHEAASRERWIDWLGRDSLVRTIREWLPDGWTATGRRDSTTSQAFADWTSTISGGDERLRAAATRVTAALMAACPPIGWIPTSGDDPVIQAAFEGAAFPPG